MNMWKERADSALSRLPQERQAEILEHLSTHSFRQTQQWLLAEQGLRISTAALACFYAWQKRSAAPAAPKGPEPVGTPPGLSGEERFEHQLAFFSIRTLARHDVRAWVGLQRLRQDQEFIKLEEERFKRNSGVYVSKWQADYERKVKEWKMAGKPISHTAILEELGKEHFGPDWKMPEKRE
jgi:hypothetical protein